MQSVGAGEPGGALWSSGGLRGARLYGCVLLVVFVSLIIRFLTSQPVESSGDAIYKWSVIKQFVLYGYRPVPLDHHIVRWSITAPVWCIQTLFGTRPTVYYIWPMLTATTTSLFSFLLLEKIHGWRVGLYGSLLVTLSLPLLRQGTQFLPSGAAMAYMTGALYLLACWQQSRSKVSLGLSAIALFLGYGAKITSIYYLPAFLVLVYVFSGDRKACWRNCLVFAGLFIGLCLAETLWINLAMGMTFGRLEVIQLKHPAIREVDVTVDKWLAYSTSLPQYLSNFFVYFAYPGKGTGWFYYLSLILASVALVMKRRPLYLVAIPFLFGFFGHAYAITNVFPFTRPEKVLLRYQSFMFVLGLMTVLLCLASPLFGEVMSRLRVPIKHRSRIRGGLLAVLMLCVVIHAAGRFHVVPGIVATARNVETIRAAREANLPIFIPMNKNDQKMIKKIVKFDALYSDTRYYGNVPGKRNYTNDLAERPVITRNGEKYLLVEDNGFVGDYACHAIVLDSFRNDD